MSAHRASSSMSALMAVALLLWPPSPARAQMAGGTFPAQRFNGLQVTYGVSGVDLGVATVSEGLTVAREYRGRITGPRLDISGTAHAENGWTAELTVTAEADGVESRSFHIIKAPPQGLALDTMDQSFSVSIEIPSGATWASFSISLVGAFTYDMVERAVEVHGRFTRDGPTTPPPVPVPHQTVTPSPPPGVEPPARGARREVARFADITGQVEVRPDDDEDGWVVAKIGTVLHENDHVRTGEDSMAALSFPDLTSFTLKPESEIILDVPPPQSKLSLVWGNIKTNFKKLMTDGSMVVDMAQAVAGTKGTTFVAEASRDHRVSTLKVLEGEMMLTATATRQQVAVPAGMMCRATVAGLSPCEPFDVAAEAASWDRLPPRATPAPPTASSSDASAQSALSGQLAGTWNWVSGQSLVIHPDGSFEVYHGGNRINDGRWVVVDAARRQVRLTHRAGGWVDTVSVSADGRSLDGVNNTGASVRGVRRSASLTDDLAGTWNWVSGQTLVVHAGGTFDVFAGGTQINRGQWVVIDAIRRQVRLTHQSGGWVDTVVVADDGRSLDGTNNRGSTLHGTRR